MSLDLFLLMLVVVFAMFGAYAGAARQLAQLCGAVLAYLCAGSLGKVAGPLLAKALNTPLLLGTVAATLAAFILVLSAVRFVVTRILRRVLAGKDPQDLRMDRALGFAIGALKIALVAYVVLSALAFVEDNVQVAGRRLGLSPRTSVAFQLARKFNLFHYTHFPAVKDLTQVLQAAADPKRAGELKGHPAFAALLKDPRFKKAIDQRSLKSAVESGDYQALLQNPHVLALVQDEQTARWLTQAADELAR